jgi:hypothetical protein
MFGVGLRAVVAILEKVLEFHEVVIHGSTKVIFVVYVSTRVPIVVLN